jgi:diguanylate cyclase
LANIMAEAVDWRTKCQQLVREFDASEVRWRDLEHILRRIISRLCVAAVGADERLDGMLNALARASRSESRNGGDVEEWTGLFSELDASVTALRQGERPVTAPPAPVAKPVAAAALWQASIAATSTLLQQLATEFSGEAGPEEAITALRVELGGVATDAALAAVIRHAAALVSGRADRLARERVEAAGLLERVTQRLEEISAYLGSVRTDRRSVLADAEDLSATVTTQVQELSVEVGASTDLGALKISVGTRLDAIATQVGEFRQREQRRYSEYQQRAEQMSLRLEQLEQQARELHRTLDDERRRARVDALTGIANRAAFDERFAQEVARCARGGGTVSVLLWDLDHFKAINDRFGHRVGDGVLREVAHCLVRELRAEDFVARIGGEEFATLLIGATVEQALQRAEALRAAIAVLKLHVHGTPVHVTVSCGATEIRGDDTAESLFDRADAALYRAKESGRNLCTAA